MSPVFIILLFLPVSVCVYWYGVPLKWRSLFLLLLSIVGVAFISVPYTVYLLAVIFLVFTAGAFLGSENRHGKGVLQLALFCLIGSLCFLKFGVELSEIILPVGISYITFRLIHYVVEAYRGNIPETSFVDFALYILFFPTFFAGPIERFPQFHSQTAAKKKIETHDLTYGLFRIASGIIKKVLIVYYLTKLIMPVLHSPETFSRPMVIVSLYGLATLIYMDFSGYTDIAIGSARLFGYSIIENFNAPFFRKNIALFWRNWHMSLYTWMRDYFFFPLFGSRASTFKLYFGIFVTIMVLHIWHGLSLNFFILGLYHVSGLTAWQLFQEVKKRYPLCKDWADSRWLIPVSTVFTFSFVSFGFVFLYFDAVQAISILRRVFVIGQ